MSFEPGYGTIKNKLSPPPEHHLVAHHQKSFLPEAAVEEEVIASSPAALASVAAAAAASGADSRRGRCRGADKKGPYLVFEITSDDGFHVRAESCDGNAPINL
jgi:hypothetical protein